MPFVVEYKVDGIERTSPEYECLEEANWHAADIRGFEHVHDVNVLGVRVRDLLKLNQQVTDMMTDLGLNDHRPTAWKRILEDDAPWDRSPPPCVCTLAPTCFWHGRTKAPKPETRPTPSLAALGNYWGRFFKHLDESAPPAERPAVNVDDPVLGLVEDTGRARE